MSGPKRTPVNRTRKASLLIDDAAVKLFARLEAVPLGRRMGYKYREHARRLAERLGVYSEHFLDAHCLNDAFLCRRPSEHDFRVAGWERVLATRKRLLELANLPPDSVDGPAYPDFDYDAAYAFAEADGDAHDFDDLDPPTPKPKPPPAVMRRRFERCCFRLRQGRCAMTATRRLPPEAAN